MTIDIDELRDALHKQYRDPSDDDLYRKVAQAYLKLLETGMMLPELPEHYRYVTLRMRDGLWEVELDKILCDRWFPAIALDSKATTPMAAAIEAIKKTGE